MSGKRSAIGGLALAVGAVAFVLVIAVVGSGHSRERVQGGRLPGDRASYAGVWLGPGFFLQIAPNGTFRYRRVDGSSAKQLTGDISAFDGASIEAIANGETTHFQVAGAPRLIDGEWRMTVDGVSLLRSPPTATSDVAVNIDCKGVTGGLDCSLVHALGAWPVKACFEVTATCRNGKTITAHACDTVQPTQTRVHRVTLQDFENFDQCDAPAGLKVHGLVLSKPDPLP